MRRLLLAALAVVLLPACGGGEARTGEAGSSDDGAVVEIALGDFEISPASAALDPGAYTFRVVNDGSVVHALELHGPTGEVGSGELPPGESTDLAVDLSTPGKYELFCPIGDHRERGMEATIAVGGGAAPATTTDDTSTGEDPDYRY